MNINDIIIKSRKYETIEIHRYQMTLDSMGREVKRLMKIGTYTVSVQPEHDENLTNSSAGEMVDGKLVVYTPIIDVKAEDLVRRVETDNLFYEVRKTEVQEVKPTRLRNGNVLNLSHIKLHISRIDNQ